jgi:DHA3 family macrolide efflux protein-like MFS transporter
MSEVIAARRWTVLPGRRTYLLLWSGQVVSAFGTGLTTFALGVWVYRETGLVTQFALIGLFSSLPAILFSPVAGVLIDRWDRRWTMILSDAVAALMTLLLVALMSADRLEPVYLYAVMAVSSTFASLRWPAYSASVSLLIERENLGRASGLDQFGQAASHLLAPAAAGFLLGVIQLEGLLLIDAATYLVSLGALLAARVPRPPLTSRDAGVEKSSLRRELKVGWRFILDRPGLRNLLLYLAMINLLAGFNSALATPLVLSMASPAKLGVVLSIFSAGLLAGSLLMSAYGGPRRRVDGVLGFGLLYSLSFIGIGLKPSLPAIATASFLLMFCVPLINGCNTAIWQSKVPPELQGRVFAVCRTVVQGTLPLAFVVAGPLADWVFKPLLAPGGALAGSLGRVLGVGEGRGLGLLYVVLGLLALIVSALARLSHRFRHLEQDLPDNLAPS